MKKPWVGISRRLVRTVGWGVLWAMSIGAGGLEVSEGKVLAKEDFESGSVSGWECRSTANGTAGGEGFPSVVDCDIEGKGNRSKCLQIKVGQIDYEPDHDPWQGSILEMRHETSAGLLRLSAQVMVTYHSPNDKRNLAGGLFEWLVDDEIVGAHDAGPIENGATARHRLRVDHPVEAGLHVIQLRISRPFKSGTGQQAPIQFLDNLSVDFSSSP